MTTKLEELKAAVDAARDAYQSTCNAAMDDRDALDDALDAYQEELEKPRVAKLEELKAAWEVADAYADAYADAAYDAGKITKATDAAYKDARDAQAAYRAELERQEENSDD
jgi:hypothetical protein